MKVDKFGLFWLRPQRGQGDRTLDNGNSTTKLDNGNSRVFQVPQVGVKEEGHRLCAMSDD